MHIHPPKPTITDGISALNEQETIVPMLKSLAWQKLESAVLEKVRLISDGSTDETVKRARALGLPNLEIIEHSERAGVARRMNEHFRLNRSDIFILNDADITYGDDYALEAIAQTFLADDSVQMACGHAEPIRGRTFMAKAVRTTFDAYAPIKASWKGGHNILSVHGCISAYRRGFADSLALPGQVLGTDVFAYLKCVEQGGSYRYVPSAAAYFSLPQTLSDQIKQNRRQQAARRQLAELLPAALFDQEYDFPKKELSMSFAGQALRHPWLCAYIFLVNKYCSLRTDMYKSLDGFWEVVSSTKNQIK